MKRLILIFIFIFSFASLAEAGPPYDTDDPEPVEFQHCEIYCSSRPVHDVDGWSGTAPHFEANYGALPELQLHIIAPLAFNAPNNGSTTYGFSDAEVGFKYRFVKESKTLPQIGIFPLIELPTGNQTKGLGSGNTQVFIPVWLQKSFGKWSTYGGTGYWINPGTGNKNYWFTGLQLQRQITDNFNVGAEIYHTTEKSETENSDTRFNIGMVFDASEHHHILFSIGRSFNNSVLMQGYIGYQLTLGSEK
jgi:hypothetical protein